MSISYPRVTVHDMPGATIVSNGQTPQMVRDVFAQVLREQMEPAMLAVQTAVVRLMPRRTGTGARSVSYSVIETGDSFIGRVGSDLNYVDLINRGTGIYGPYKQRIYPKNKQALKFPAGGAGFTAAGRRRRGAAGSGASYVIVRSVKGVKPMHFFERGIDDSRGTWTAKLAETSTIARRRLELGRAA